MRESKIDIPPDNMMMTKEYSISAFLLLFILSITTGCHLWDDQEEETLFKNMPESRTSIDFSNDISYDQSFNILNYSYLYNGGGVATGDINNDGRSDLYFTGNMVSSRLYLNKGDFKFEDITESSGTGTKHWAGGASMVDINHDGKLDIYVSVTGPEHSTPEERANRLFINNGDNTFTESAAEYGLADTRYTTHTAFFDYDRDGDLDAYLMNNFAGSFSRDSKIRMRPEINDGSSPSADALYRNNGDGTFTDISREAGILKEGYSLGIAVSDVNRDGWPDVYVSNDIQTDDLLYINNRDGSFTDKAAEYLKHTSYAGMGTDIADFNNDGWPDILQVDMMPPSLQKQQLVSGAISYEYLRELKQKGYQPQYTLNTLQLNNGRDAAGDLVFSEIAQMAGIAYTDWSWTGLFGDYDNDGLKDIMITNGYPKAVNNYDYLMKLNRSTMFGTDSSRAERRYKTMDNLSPLKLPNYIFRNDGNLVFTDVSKEWGVDVQSFSYGAAHVDLDNDGDLDIAISNINGKANILQNRADTLKTNHYLALRLQGDSLNTNGIGATITLTANGNKQYKYVNPYRGYQSTMDTKIYFGLGSEETVDSLEILWPDNSYQLLEKVEADQVLDLDYKNAQHSSTTETRPSARFFVHASDNIGIDYEHTENEYVDFMSEPLVPRMLSRLGPAVAVGDINNDGLEDLFLGGANGSAGTLYLQQKEGDFVESDNQQAWLQDISYEDIDATFFDANGDGWQDLYVVSGGNRFSPASEQLQDRLYLNSGDGDFVKTENMLPRMYTSGSAVKAADYDGDGDQDLFIGGRHVPGQYPKAARSYILRNDGGSFTDVTSKIAPDLIEPGLITDATWIDFNEDGAMDLVTTGIWMPVSFFENRDGQFQNVTSATGLDQQVGWWQSIEKADLDGDGDMDLVAGNLGLNTEYSTSGSSLKMLVNDFDNNQRRDAILVVEKEDGYYPLHGMRNMARQFPRFTQNNQTYGRYAAASMSDLFGQELVDEAGNYSVNNFASSIIMNEDGADFLMKPLPNEAQISPVNDILISDINKDDNPDLIVAGNIYNPNPETVRNDASNGLLLLGTGDGEFKSVSPFESGFLAPQNVRKLIFMETEQADYVIVTNNNSKPQILQLDR